MYEKVIVIYKGEEMIFEKVSTVYTTNPFLAIIMQNQDKILLLNSDITRVDCIVKVENGK